MDHQKLTKYLEILCQGGCDSVNTTIQAMEKKQAISISDSLSDDEYAIVLQELKAIMSVYKH
ncbi:MAG: hypothetical protein KZQ70_07640 [gamma proteobacterium symbiont of Lucinoma myriamae]|nr:hypothetical protein [gamma proteobacterium symbiont of Lucinoma myriamae]MCU7820003.1 hypothetical protein [gamma proteobacterium symbiont of Lucinoma myriamae]MCU7832389.1 hypothetical protein [gamma proteobacterium symbiont of Lucinoma myriamae]